VRGAARRPSDGTATVSRPPHPGRRPPVAGAGRIGGVTVVLSARAEGVDAERGVRVATEVCRSLVASRALERYEIVVRTASFRSGRRPPHDPAWRGSPAPPGAAADDSREEVVLLADPSRPCDLLELPKALRLLRVRGADVVSAYRHHRMGDGPSRALASWAWDHTVAALSRAGVRDVAFPFNLCRLSAVGRLDLDSDSPFLHTELIVRAHRHGLRIVQFGIDSPPSRRTRRPDPAPHRRARLHQVPAEHP
jgi:hypothetical protein